MRTVRIGIFETNSSSTHVLTICSEEDYDKFAKGDLEMDCGCDKLVTFAEMYDEMKKWYRDQCGFTEEEPYKVDFENSLTLDCFRQIVKSKDKLCEYRKDENGERISYRAAELLHSDWEAVSLFCRYRYRKFNEIPEWVEETFREDFTTKSGDKIVAFGYHGHC